MTRDKADHGLPTGDDAQFPDTDRADTRRELDADPAPFSGGQDAFYREAMELLESAGVPYLVGGAYALRTYTGIERDTKDFDVFILREDVDRALATLASSGMTATIPFPHWLAKASRGEESLDLIFSSGNGVAGVDESWFSEAAVHEVFGRPVKVCPIEEIIWSKAFIMERERFDGADVLHLLHHRAHEIRWDHLLERFGPNWRVLLAHLVLFGFAYPNDRQRIPHGVVDGLVDRLRRQEARRPPTGRVCRGTLLSRAQYLVDIVRWGYNDARLAPHGSLTEEDVERWTAPLEDGEIPR
ncbi:MAG: nucleotidyltransferase [Candidatus Krumholzibacteriia bacterium]